MELQDGDEEETIDAIFTKYENDIDIFERKSSGWIIEKINSLTMAVTRYKKLYGAKGGIKIRLPASLA
jgi:hypothetical protein